MTTPNKSPVTFNKWDKLIQDMDEIPDGIEPDKMRVLLPHLRATSNNENCGSQSNEAQRYDPMKKYEKLIQDENETNSTDQMVALIEGRKNELNRSESSLYDKDFKEKMIESEQNEGEVRHVLTSLNSPQSQDRGHSMYEVDHLENSQLVAMPTFNFMEEDSPMVSTHQKSWEEPESSSKWLDEVRKPKSWSGRSLKRTSSDDCEGSNDNSQSISSRRRPKRGKYPWEIVKQAANQCPTSFKTAGHQLMLDAEKKHRKPAADCEKSQWKPAADCYGMQKRSLGTTRAVGSKFIPPVKRDEEGNCESRGITDRPTDADNPHARIMTDDRLKNIEARMVELIMNEILDSSHTVTWDDIAGLDTAKITIQEIVVWPMLRPDIFTGLRGPPKGILLFGPPGTGKTLIGKCIASQSESTFFSISASSLTSKWIGEGEKMVRALFAVARCHQPAVIFIDEIDSLLSQRSESEHESSRRMKTEFLVQLDGATCVNDERILVVGATNRPQELDEAARRRLVKRLYIPLPNMDAREHIIRNLLKGHSNSLEDVDVKDICSRTDGYSGADMANLCREAALGPIRSISLSQIRHISVDEVRPISAEDFRKALNCIKASVSEMDLQMYEDWNNKFGITLNQSFKS